MKETLMENSLILEMIILGAIILVCILVFIGNNFLKKKLHNKKIFGISRVFNKLFLMITDRFINKLGEKDKDIKEVNKELQKVISENFMRENQDDKPKEEIKDKE